MADIEQLAETMREKGNTLADLGHRVRFDLTDTDTAILLDATGPVVEVSVGPGEADAVLSLSSDTLDKLISGRLGPMVAFATGRLKVAGSQGVALKLAGLLEG